MNDRLDPAAFEAPPVQPPDPPFEALPPYECDYPPEGDPLAPPPPPPVRPPYGLEEMATPLPAEPPSDASETLSSAVERLETAVTVGVAEILAEFRDKLALDRFKEDQITRLHEELQAYRNDLVSRASRQILQGVIRLHDDLGKVATSVRQKPAGELTPERFFQQLEGFQDDIELLLGQHGVERFEVEGEEFDPRRQTALRTIPTEDPTQVGRVAEHLRPGFLQGETLLQKERVAVYAAAHAKA